MILVSLFDPVRLCDKERTFSILQIILFLKILLDLVIVHIFVCILHHVFNDYK